MFEKNSETVQHEKWVWTDPDTFDGAGIAFNGRIAPLVVASIAIVAFFTILVIA